MKTFDGDGYVHWNIEHMLESVFGLKDKNRHDRKSGIAAPKAYQTPHLNIYANVQVQSLKTATLSKENMIHGVT
jgi:hypothetical protein